MPLRRRNAAIDGPVSEPALRFRLVVSGHLVVLGPGDWVEIPRGSVHSAAVVGAEPVVGLDAVKLSESRSSVPVAMSADRSSTGRRPDAARQRASSGATSMAICQVPSARLVHTRT
jgi:hypothetical protein